MILAGLRESAARLTENNGVEPQVGNTPNETCEEA